MQVGWGSVLSMLVAKWHSGHRCGAAAGFWGLTFTLPLEKLVLWPGVQCPLAHSMPGCLLAGTESIQPQIFTRYSGPWDADQLE